MWDYEFQERNMAKKLVIKTFGKKGFLALFLGLSPERLSLLWKIRKFQPESIYELAEKTGKKQPYLQKEVSFLATKGLIKLTKHKQGGRSKIKPELQYQVLCFELDLLNE